jgi:hypothetical protein
METVQRLPIPAAAIGLDHSFDNGPEANAPRRNQGRRSDPIPLVTDPDSVCVLMPSGSLNPQLFVAGLVVHQSSPILGAGAVDSDRWLAPLASQCSFQREGRHAAARRR